MNLLKLSLIGIVFFWGGCSKPSAPMKTPHKPYPSWYLNITPDNSSYFYCVGSGKTKDEAIANALSQLVSQLGVEVSSSYHSDAKIENHILTKKLQQKINIEVENIRISNYRVTDIEKYKYNEILVRIQSNRAKIVSALKEEIDTSHARIKKQIALVSNHNQLESEYQINRLKEVINTLTPKILILGTLDNSYDTKEHYRLIATIDKLLDELHRKMLFNIEGDHRFVPILEGQVAKLGYNLSKNSNALVFKVTVNESIINATSMVKIALFNITLALYQKNQLIGKKNMRFKERYSNDKVNLNRNIIIHFEEKIANKNLQELMLREPD